MGGTGLEPVTPSLSIAAVVRTRSHPFAKWLKYGDSGLSIITRANPNERQVLPLLPRSSHSSVDDMSETAVSAAL
jgi:hypothetical protein